VQNLFTAVWHENVTTFNRLEGISRGLLQSTALTHAMKHIVKTLPGISALNYLLIFVINAINIRNKTTIPRHILEVQVLLKRQIRSFYPYRTSHKLVYIHLALFRQRINYEQMRTGDGKTCLDGGGADYCHYTKRN
jgi:hypothetical protein